MKSTSEIVISAKHVSKDFILPHEKITTVKGLFTSALRHRTTTKEVQHALRDVSFEIKKGEFFGIVGRNGSGKSTMLKMLAGIYQPSKGKLTFSGKLVPFIELGVGFNPELTGRENVYLNGAMMGFSEKETDAMYEEIVTFAELEAFMDQKLKNYSSGMQVRLAFSVAIKAEADILLVDEVLAVGDADFQRKCYQYFKSLKKNNKTVIFVSHDMNAVREYCDRAILIEDGAIQAEGKAERVAQEYLRLFSEGNEETTNAEAVKEENRWGNRWAHYQKVTSTLAPNVLTIALTVKAEKDALSIVHGFRIRSESGEEILGTNSSILGKKPVVAKKNKVTHIQWEVPNIFSNGTYYIEPALVLDDGTVCDWWNEAAKFTVTKRESTMYPVTPDIKFALKG